MCTPEVTFKDSLAGIGTFPSLATCPTTTNIRVLEINLVNKLTMIPSEQTVNFRYSGKLEADVVYTLKSNIPWVDWQNPGPHVTLADNLTDCCGETASGRSREAHARQIARAEKPQAQDARAIKKARLEIKSKKTFESIYG